MNTETILVFAGGFLGVWASIMMKYSIKAAKFRDWKNYVLAFVLSFAIYGVYVFLVSAGFIQVDFSKLALFGIAVFLGFSLDELARYFYQLLKKAA
ncbi:hypothetical protein J4433_00500 [Candidatus Pacearchaeota archaeon]|nr:hypothetical protein [Candidatus Pacearchaeota archaeon]